MSQRPRLIHSASMSAKLSVLNIAALTILALCLIVITVVSVRDGLEKQIITRQESSMAVAWELLHAKGKTVSIDKDRLMAGSEVLNGNNALVDRIHDLVGGVATIFMNDQRVATTIIKPDGTRAVGTRLAPGPAHDAVFGKRQSYQGVTDILGQHYYVRYDPILDPSGAVVGILFVGVPRNDFMVLADSLTDKIIGISVGVTLILGLIVFWITRRSFAALNAVQAALKTVADGDLSRQTPFINRMDEIGQMARAVEVSRENALKAQALEEANRQAEQRRQEERRRELTGMADHFQDSVQKAAGAIANESGRVRNASEAMSALASEASQRAESVVGAAQNAAANVGIVASASTELSASIQDISRQITRTSAITANAVTEAERTDRLVLGLTDSAARIGEVVRLITDIASQTNMLALNASIEAARAGDAGKGFAVVAGEVKNLANQTGRATKDISVQITAVQTATNEAADAIRAIRTIIADIDEATTSIAAAIEEQDAATGEIARSIGQASENVSAINDQIRMLSGTTREVGETSDGVLGVSREMSSEVNRLDGSISAFLNGIKSSMG